MRQAEHTIESGLTALMEKAKHHREQADRFDRLALAFREAEAALRTTNGHGEVIKSIGRPANNADRKKVEDAIASMPAQFSLPELKKVASVGNKDAFRRVFRELKKEGAVIEKIRATGRQPGLYLKKEQAAIL